MKKNCTLFLIVTALLSLAGVLPGHAQTTAFTYQGRLSDNGVPANGNYDLTFGLRDSLTAGNPVGSPVNLAPVWVTNGVFTVTLDFGAVPFIGADRWLEIGVRPMGNTDPHVILSPRQAITSTPYSTFAGGVNSSGIIGQLTDSQIATTLSVARTFNHPNNQFTGNYTGNGGGLTNLPATSLVGSLALGLNPGLTGVNSGITGGEGNTNAALRSLIGAGVNNTISSGANIFLGAGGDNEARGQSTFLGAGADNFLDANAGVLVGGIQNANRGNYSFLGAGSLNNIASGAQYGVIAGGQDNQVNASYGFAAGRRAQANHAGSFVWADPTGASFASTADNQFLVRAGGGVGINKNNPQTALDVNGTVTASGFAGDGSGLLNLPASAISGALAANQIPSLDAAKIAAGTFADELLSTGIARSAIVWNKGGNAGTTPGSDFIGTTDNQALEIKVNNARTLRVQAGSSDGTGSPNWIGGFAGNSFIPERRGAVISGGGEVDSINSVGDNFATVSGGSGNNAAAEYTTVGGGLENAATANFGTVLGGRANTASGGGSTVLGGEVNTASGTWSVVPGGLNNVASGNLSLAAGRRANASHVGAFVWADSTDADFVSTSDNQFLIRAGGNVGINKNNPQTALDVNGTVTASGFRGNGSALTSLPAGNLEGSLALGLDPLVTGAHSGVTGGQSNTNIADRSLIGGGIGNTISSGANIFLGAGGDNEARGQSTFLGAGAENFLNSNAGVLVGGIQNANRGNYSFLGAGGLNNIAANAEYAVIPGGLDNQVTASFGFAAGYGANAAHLGSFVWADSTGASFASTADNQFLIRAGGNVGINRNNPQTALDVNGTVTASAFAGDGSGLLNLPASAISGALAAAQIPSLDASKLTSGTIADGRLAPGIARDAEVWLKGGNAGTTPGTDFIGTTDNQALEIKVNNSRAMTIRAGNSDGTGSPNIAAGFGGNSFDSDRRGAVIAGGGETGAVNSTADNFGTVSGGSANSAIGEYSTVGGGSGNSASGNFAVINGGNGNTTTGAGSVIGGGQNNETVGLQSTVSGGASDRAVGDYSVVAGGRMNVATGFDSSISGGNSNLADNPGSHVGGGQGNQAAGNYSVIAGGLNNAVSGHLCTVGGGQNNVATLFTSVVSGGEGNQASGGRSTVSGGQNNIASGTHSAVAGGLNGVAQGEFSTVAGGHNNNAGGNYSFAAGRRAKANNAGAFVWADSTDADIASSADNQFTVRASGGIRMFSNAGASSGVSLAAGSGTWASLSDRNAKENIAPVDGKSVLEKVAALPIAIWNYRTQDNNVKHVGPMAQDFRAAFGLGENETTITTVDADGVALAAIQGLNQVVKEKDAKIEQLEGRLAELEKLVNAVLKK